MCSPVVDCKTCTLIEKCPRVAKAFPTEAEEEAAMPNSLRGRLRNNGRKGRAGVGWEGRKKKREAVCQD